MFIQITGLKNVKMRRLKRFLKWYFNENAKYYAECLEHRVNPFLP